MKGAAPNHPSTANTIAIPATLNPQRAEATCVAIPSKRSRRSRTRFAAVKKPSENVSTDAPNVVTRIAKKTVETSMPATRRP